MTAQILKHLQYTPRNMHTVFALLCFVVVIHWLIFPYPSGLLHWHCGNLTIALVPAKQPWWIWINTSCEFIMNDCITTTKQSTTKPCAYFLGYTVYSTFEETWNKDNTATFFRWQLCPGGHVLCWLIQFDLLYIIVACINKPAWSSVAYWSTKRYTGERNFEACIKPHTSTYNFEENVLGDNKYRKNVSLD